MDDITTWAIVSALLCLVLAVVVFLKQGRGGGGNRGGGGRPQEAVARGPGGRRVGGGRMRPRREEQEELEEERRQEEEEEREELEETLGKTISGNIGKKKMQKLQDKAEKKKQREAEQKEREENKKKRETLDEQERLEREREKEEERKKEEEEKIIREEKERREHEEYLKLKEAFSVEDEGCDAGDEEEAENMLLQFINYIKDAKVVKLEDLAAHFKLKTQETIDRINTLMADGLLTGVIDDRGKFIYISQEELEAVAKYIKQQDFKYDLLSSSCPDHGDYETYVTGAGLMQSALLTSAAAGSLMLPGSFPYYLEMIQDMHYGSAMIFATKFALSFPVFFHMFNGFRHLAWDMGHGFQIPQLYKTGYTVLGLAVITALMVSAM